MKEAKNDIDFSPNYGINNFRPLEILVSLLSRRGKEYLGLWRWGACCLKAQLEMIDDLVYNRMIIDKRNDLHLAKAFGAKEGIYLINLPDHLRPTFAGGRSKGLKIPRRLSYVPVRVRPSACLIFLRREVNQ